MKVTIVGLGLIGGSIGLDLRETGMDLERTGVDLNPDHGHQAVGLGLVDSLEPEGKGLSEADVIILSIPVNAASALIPEVLDVVKKGAVVIDTGSTKAAICKSVRQHPNRGQFVAAHPLAGTENSGPTAALKGLFAGKINIVCEQELSAPEALATASKIFEALGLKTIFMDPEDHDRHVAYVSHLSHVSSFLLGQTVLDIEKDEKRVFNLAGTGFASTVRLAKSAPDTWAPIFEQNAEYLGQALTEYIMHLQRFQYLLMKRNTREIHRVLKDANKIRGVLDGMTQPKKEKA